jgi:hypothetical protein
MARRRVVSASPLDTNRPTKLAGAVTLAHIFQQFERAIRRRPAVNQVLDESLLRFRGQSLAWILLGPPMTGEQSAILNPRAGMIDHRSPPEAKIALFRAIFRGREDVYPRRFESRRTGKTGYQPACANEWIRGVCEKPRIKCTDCPHQRFLSASDEAVRWHLSGHDSDGNDFVMGIYPMLQDETCFLLAVDFDQGNWREDARAFRETCDHLNIPAALERSRSGDGAHIWIFFDRAIPAALARKLGSHILTEAMERRPEIGFNSYDRFFPNQDTLPRGGFGNLIALPLQRQPRESGNSLFLDESLVPYSDQWAFLSAIRRIDRPAVENIVREAETADRIVGIQRALPEEDDQAPPQASSDTREFTGQPLSSFSATRSTLQKMPSRLVCAIGCFVWPLFRTPNSTGPRRCVCLRTTSRGSLPALRNIHLTSACRAAAWPTCNSFCAN